ncbi:hypothetical protein UPYG_G00031660 [Umbra pygmaea]|uniref:Uncharacterized protein n=1 Tax=Umbra pygmaea TaxID=75934 RepID=A0ABD0XMW8_UMBPY
MMGKDNHNKPVIKSYRDALQTPTKQDRAQCANIVKTSAKPKAPTTTQNHHLTTLRSSICDLICQYPEGILLSQIRQACPLVLHPDVLEPYPSTRQLLASLPDVVRLEGFGVQTLVLPALQHDHCDVAVSNSCLLKSQEETVRTTLTD